MNFLRPHWLIYCLLLTTAATAAALEEVHPPAILRIDAEPDETGTLNLRLSDRVRLTLIVEGSTPDFPTRFIQSPDWDVREQEATTLLIEGKRRWRQEFLVAPRKAGSLVLAPQPVRIDGAVVDWKPVPVMVTTEVGRADVKELRDVLPPEPAPPEPPVLRWLAWSGGGVAGLGILLVVWRALRCWRLRRPKPLTPAEEALRELERIESLRLPSNGQSERYHTLVADTVRGYLERRFQLHAPRQTTTEFLLAMQNASELSEPHRAHLREFLERCDVVKFAGQHASADACAAVANLARTVIQQTASAETCPSPGPLPE